MLFIACGGFFGAISRYALSQFISRKFPSAIPYGTLAVNLLGSFLLGLLAGMRVSSLTYQWIGIGFMGAFTTFSTFSLENVQMMYRQRWRSMLFYMIFSIASGIVLALMGYAVGAGLSNNPVSN